LILRLEKYMKWRFWLIGFGLVIFVGLIVVSRQEISEAWKIIGGVKWNLLLSIPFIQLLVHCASAKYYQSFLRQLGYNFPFGQLFKLSLGVNFVAQAFPSGGLSSTSFITYGLKAKVPAGKAALAQAGRYTFTFLSYILILITGVSWLIFENGLQVELLWIVAILGSTSIFALTLFLLAFKWQQRFDAFVFSFQNRLDRLYIKFTKKKAAIGSKRIENLLKEFHNGYNLLITSRSTLTKPIIFAFLINVLEVLTLFMVFLALGEFVNPGVVIVGYAAANTAGAASFIPGDLGVFETALVLALDTTGITLAMAISVTVLYRFMNKIVFLPIGFVLYSMTISGGKNGRSNFKR
jgi:uncharacterized protein (TIRG00374 family)